MEAGTVWLGNPTLEDVVVFVGVRVDVGVVVVVDLGVVRLDIGVEDVETDEIAVVVVVFEVVVVVADTQPLAPHVLPGAQTLQAVPKVHCTAVLVQQTAPIL
jgi:hypothetical protein